MDGYVRVSVVGGRSGDRFQSPDQQRDAITAWAKAHGVTIAAWHEDLDRSGGTMDRPGMNAAIRRIGAGMTGGIVCARLDRFARTLIGGLTTIQDIHAKGGRVVSVAENIDPTTPMGRAMLGLLLLMAEWVRDQASVALQEAQSRSVAAGRFPGKPAYGYVKDDDGRTLIDPVRAEVVRRIYALRADGTGWRKISDLLNQSGIPTSTGGAYWAVSSLHALIRSESYLGTFTGPNQLRVEGAWEPIIPLELWNRANAVKGVRDDSRAYQDRLYAGLVRCSQCRYTMRRDINPHGFVSYGCKTRGCTKPTIGASLLDSYVTALVDARMAGIRLESSAAADHDLEHQRLTQARNRAAQALEEWRDDLDLRDVLGDADWRAGMKARAQARDDTETDLADWRARVGLQSLTDLPAGVDLRLGRFPREVQRSMIEMLIHSVWVRKSGHRGGRARQRVSERVRVVWSDDRHPPVFPSRGGGHPGPYLWDAT